MRCRNRFGIGFVVVTFLNLAVAPAAHAGDPMADLLVESSAPAETSAGADVAFTVMVTNLGPDQANNVDVHTTVPDGTSFVSAVQSIDGPSFLCATPSGGALSGNIDCTASGLPNGVTVTFTFTFQIDAAAAPGFYVTDIAVASSDTFDPNDENSSGVATTQTPPPPAADMVLTKTAAPGANPGTDIVYTIEVVNGGPGDATTVAVTDTLPGTMTFVSLSQSGTAVLDCSMTPAVGQGGTVTCSMGTFPAHASVVLTLIGQVPLGTGEGQGFQNFASVTSDYDPNSENDESNTLTCIQSDSCAAGDCNAFHAVVCPPAAQCQIPGTCNTVTGLCSPSTPAPNGGPCDDGNACSQTDTCQAGACVGGNPVVCPTANDCQTQSRCNPTTGTCPQNPSRPDGISCDDGDACTQIDTCLLGTCQGYLPVECPAANDCQFQGECDPMTGLCDPNPSRPNGLTCDDGNSCTTGEICMGGQCVGTAFCPLAGPCEIQGSCNADTHECGANTLAPDGTSCDDGDPCTGAGSCQAGACAAGPAIVCPAAGPCQMPGVCDPMTGACGAGQPLPGGTGCDDGDACTQGETCQAGGVCGAGTAINCDDGIACTVDTCDHVLGCLHVDTCIDAGPVPDAPIVIAHPDAQPARDGGVVALPDARRAGADASASPGGTHSADARVGDAGTMTPASGDGGGCRTSGGDVIPELSWLALLGVMATLRLRGRRLRTS